MINSIPPDQKWKGGYSDYEWLHEQALDETTHEFIEMRRQDEENFLKNGVITQGNEIITLRFKQGTFFTTRATGHSISHIFVQIFKQREHIFASGFDASGEEDRVVVDIGANEGYYAITMSKNPNTTVYAIEPNPAAYDLLSRNIAVNERENIVPLNYAVWSSAKDAELSIVPQVTSIGTLNLLESNFMARVPERVRRIPVQTITLVDLVEKYDLSWIDILKIDTEGSELEIVKGALPVLDRVGHIVVEYHNPILRNALIDLLAEEGYQVVCCAPERDNFGDLYFSRSKQPVEVKLVANKAAMI